MKFLGYVRSIKKKLFRSSSVPKSKPITEDFTLHKFCTYEDIMLRIYLEIAAQGNYEKLILAGNPSTEECIEAWEEIVKENAKQNGTFEYQTYLEDAREHTRLLNEYNLVKAILTKLSFVVDYELVNYLQDKGYRIDISSSEKYADSLTKAIRKSDNLITKINMKRNELAGLETKKGGKSSNYEEIMASLEFALGWSVGEDITLARYNALKKLAKKKAESTKRDR